LCCVDIPAKTDDVHSADKKTFLAILTEGRDQEELVSLNVINAFHLTFYCRRRSTVKPANTHSANEGPQSKTK